MHPESYFAFSSLIPKLSDQFRTFPIIPIHKTSPLLNTYHPQTLTFHRRLTHRTITPEHHQNTATTKPMHHQLQPSPITQQSHPERGHCPLCTHLPRNSAIAIIARDNYDDKLSDKRAKDENLCVSAGAIVSPIINTPRRELIRRPFGDSQCGRNVIIRSG